MRDRGMAPQQEPREDGRESPPVRAAQYVRMSTDHQQYSTENQAETIREYAARHGLLIVRSYADEGKSGLRLEGRDQLQRLIADVENGSADFQVVLVYDVSRWGRGTVRACRSPDATRPEMVRSRSVGNLLTQADPGGRHRRQ